MILFCVCSSRSRLGHRHAGQRGGHVEQGAFVQRRHELAAQLHRGIQAYRTCQCSDGECGLLALQYSGDERAIACDQPAVQRVLRFRSDLAFDEQQHQHRHQRDGEQGCSCHGEGLGVGERCEQSSFLCFQREYRQEGDGDDEQREEQGRADFLAGIQHRIEARLAFLQPLDMLMRILYHHDGRIHHRPDGDRDAAQAHDVGVQIQKTHGDEGDQHADGQHHDGDQCAARMHQEHHAYQRHDQSFLKQACA